MVLLAWVWAMMMLLVGSLLGSDAGANRFDEVRR